MSAVLGKLGMLAVVLGALVVAGCTAPQTPSGATTTGGDAGSGAADGSGNATGGSGNSTQPPAQPEANATVSTPAGNTSASAVNVTDVTIVDNSYQPSEVQLAAGGAVQFTNEGSNVHSITIERGGPGGTPFFDQDSNPNSTVLVPFPDGGVYYLHCKYHPDMTGNITVA